MIDADEWIRLTAAFDAAKDDLVKLGEKVLDVGQGLTVNWHDFHPLGKPTLSDYKSGREDFNAHDWPSGERIHEALDKCHQAYRVLLIGYKELSENQRKAFKLDREPEP
jgi:hypothetical protein